MRLKILMMNLSTDKQIFDTLRMRKGSGLTQKEVEQINNILNPPREVPPMAWGARVSKDFRIEVLDISCRLGCDPSDLMACIAWESGRTFSPSVKNMAGSGAVGLIQFMPATAKGLGTSTENLAAMSAVHQLYWVEKYFQPYRGRLLSIADLYMAILWPAAVGKSMSYVLWTAKDRPTTYRQNIGLDTNKDGAITKNECAKKLYDIKAEGRLSENMA